jgi:hypothetical protein
MTRTDIPQDLIDQARALGPAVLEALIATYPTDEEHARHQRRKRGQRAQLVLPLTNRTAA